MRCLSCAIVFALLLGAYATALAGDVYIWKDEQGGVHIGDKPPTDGRGSEHIRGSVET